MKLTQQEFQRIAKALSDPARCEILEQAALSGGEISCVQIFERMHLTQATISHHLKELATAGLLERRKEGQYGYYRFCTPVMLAYIEELRLRLHLAAVAPVAELDVFASPDDRRGVA